MNRAHFRGNSTRRSQPYKALARVCAFLEIDPKLGEKIERAGTMILSDTLDYVNFRKVLSGFVTYLKPGGRLIILNLPHRGNQLLFSDQGPKDNRLLYSFLEEHCFEIEHKDFPKRPRNEKDESELILLVARNRDDDSRPSQHLSGRPS